MFGAPIQSAITDVSGVNNTTLAFGSNLTGGNLLVATMVMNNTTTGLSITTPTDTRGHTWQAALAQQTVNTETKMQTFFVPNCTAGANTVTFDISGATTGEITATICEIPGGHLTSPLSGTPVLLTPTTTTTPTTPNITPADNNCLLYAVLHWGGISGITATEAADWTLIREYEGVNITVTCSVIYKIQTTATAENANWTLSSSRTSTAHLIAFKPALITSPFPPWPRRKLIRAH